jgi:hypothetical protein
MAYISILMKKGARYFWGRPSLFQFRRDICQGASKLLHGRIAFVNHVDLEHRKTGKRTLIE